jgi:hypothetical protein
MYSAPVQTVGLCSCAGKGREKVPGTGEVARFPAETLGRVVRCILHLKAVVSPGAMYVGLPAQSSQ